MNKQKDSVRTRLLTGVVALILSGCTPKYSTVTPELHTQFLANLKAGKTTLTCGSGCHWSWLQNFNQMMVLHNAGQWEPLAVLVMQVGHEMDLAYYFLGRAAEGLGYPQAAMAYYQISVYLTGDSNKLHHCREWQFGCGGVDLASLLPMRLAAVQAEERPLMSIGQTSVASMGAGHPKVAVQPITNHLLNNISVSLPNGVVTFKEGKYNEGVPGVTPDHLEALIVERALGDLNGDGVEDGAILTSYTMGGSGIFISVAGVLATSTKPWVSNSLELGDRPKITSFNIKSGKIWVDALIAGPNDPRCCPSKKTTLVYGIENGVLVSQS